MVWSFTPLLLWAQRGVMYFEENKKLTLTELVDYICNSLELENEYLKLVDIEFEEYFNENYFLDPNSSDIRLTVYAELEPKLAYKLLESTDLQREDIEDIVEPEVVDQIYSSIDREEEELELF